MTPNEKITTGTIVVCGVLIAGVASTVLTGAVLRDSFERDAKAQKAQVALTPVTPVTTLTQPASSINIASQFDTICVIFEDKESGKKYLCFELK